jgi:hypothetical protein
MAESTCIVRVSNLPLGVRIEIEMLADSSFLSNEQGWNTKYTQKLMNEYEET